MPPHPARSSQSATSPQQSQRGTKSPGLFYNTLLPVSSAAPPGHFLWRDCSKYVCQRWEGGGTLLRHAEARMTTPQLESSLVNEAGLFTNGCVGKARSSTAADGFPRSFNPGRGSIWALAPRVPTSSRYRELSRTEIRQARSNNQLSLQKKSCQQTSLVYKRACPVVSLCVALRVSPPICFLHAPSDSSSLLVKPLRHSLDCTMAAMKKAAMKKAMKAHAPAEAAPAKKTMKKAMKAKK